MGNIVINLLKGELSLEVENKKINFNVFRTLKEPPKSESYCKIITVDTSVIEKNMLKTTKHLKELDKA